MHALLGQGRNEYGGAATALEARCEAALLTRNADATALAVATRLQSVSAGSDMLFTVYSVQYKQPCAQVCAASARRTISTSLTRCKARQPLTRGHRRDDVACARAGALCPGRTWGWRGAPLWRGRTLGAPPLRAPRAARPGGRAPTSLTALLYSLALAGQRDAHWNDLSCVCAISMCVKVYVYVAQLGTFKR